VNQAFVLGAGLGTRLRPLTHRLPKPLVPLFHRPLAAWAIDACMRAGISRFAVNTHHLAHCWETFGEPVAASEPVSAVNGIMPFWREYRGCELAIFHEPELLETGGGLKNIARWMGNAPLLIHNGDIFSSMPLDRLIAAHRAGGRPVTLALRSHGPATHIALDTSGTRVIDIRGRLGRAESTHGFSGIYCVDPEFLDLLPGGEKISVIPAFLELAQAGKLGAVVIDEGDWLDLGDRESYLRAHQELALGPRIHPATQIAADARITGSVIGPAAKIGAGARLRNCVVWPGGEVAAGADLEQCVVFSEAPASGRHVDVDL
jgi:mannose-1-phosphate guanylyltransferase